MASDPFESAVLTIRFEGPDLKKRSMPIYDLGTALIAAQRIINKAHQAEEGLSTAPVLQLPTRKMLSLQIAAHRKTSDFFALVPFLTDRHSLEVVSAAATFAVDILKSFATKQIENLFTSKNTESKQIYAGAVYGDVINVVNRIDNSGFCQAIEIGAPSQNSAGTARFDSTSRDYVRALENVTHLGPIQTVKGSVIRLVPRDNVVEIRVSYRRKVKVIFDQDLFDKVRYSKHQNQYLQVSGRPRYRLSARNESFNEFEGQSFVESAVGD